MCKLYINPVTFRPLARLELELELVSQHSNKSLSQVQIASHYMFKRPAPSGLAACVPTQHYVPESVRPNGLLEAAVLSTHHLPALLCEFACITNCP